MVMLSEGITFGGIMSKGAFVHLLDTVPTL